MTIREQVILMASYNEWMNHKVYESAARLTPQALAADQNAFFGSLLGTLNHIVVADIVWLKRFVMHPSRHAALDSVCHFPQPSALNQILFDDFTALANSRKHLDDVINQWATSLTDQDLEHSLQYANMKGIVSKKRFSTLVLHFFNHQTHHRGQATTLLYQAGQDVGVTDLLALIPNEDGEQILHN
jgi:uncharacterized damage-inducible protein DinB